MAAPPFCTHTVAMETTQTERLLREAAAICRRETGRETVSDDLLAAVFRRLAYEAERVDEDAGDWPDGDVATVH